MSTDLKLLKSAMNMQIAGEFADAEKIYMNVLNNHPDNFDALHLLGLIRAEEDDYAVAVDLIEKAIELKPDAAAFHHNIAGIYRRLGRLVEAEAQFRLAIELKPDYGEAYQGLAEMVDFKPDDSTLPRMLDQLESGQLDEKLKCYFHFALGKYYDDVGEYTLAFEHYKCGNKATGRKFDSAAFRQQVKDTLYVFSPELIQGLDGVGHQSNQPVFIIGMPRSGTTLVEQILASHSQVFGAGELNDMKFIARDAAKLSRFNHVYPNCIPGLGADHYAELGSRYLNRLSRIVADDYPRIIDKHPLNFMFVGLIFLMLPKAKIIHTIRNPLDTCISCFFQNFTKGQDYSFDLKSLGNFYNDYRRLMSHWNLLFGDRIIEVAYEDLLADPRLETGRLLDYCQLEYEDACATFHETERVVKTASFLQVRRPIYQTSKDRWKNYSSLLNDLARLIGEPINEPVTISTLGKAH